MISSTNRVAGPFQGDGVTSTFPFTFKVFSATDLLAATIITASGAIATLALTTDYSATLNADQDTSPGGSITLVAGPLAVGTTLVITTGLAALQNLDLTNGGAFYPDTVNSALDSLVILIQQALVKVGLALQLPVAEAGAAQVTLPPAAQRAGKLLMFDADGNLQLVPVAAGGTVPGAQTAVGTVDGANTVFTFVAAAGATPTPMVFAGGVLQTPSSYAISYVSGTTWQLTFVNAPISGTVTVVLLA